MLSYRVSVFALLATITYYFTGNAGQTTTISVVFNVAGSLVYYAYERLWDAINWGKPGAPRLTLVNSVGTRIPVSARAATPPVETSD